MSNPEEFRGRAPASFKILSIHDAKRLSQKCKVAMEKEQTLAFAQKFAKTGINAAWLEAWSKERKKDIVYVQRELPGDMA